MYSFLHNSNPSGSGLVPGPLPDGLFDDVFSPYPSLQPSSIPTSERWLLRFASTTAPGVIEIRYPDWPGSVTGGIINFDSDS